MSQNITNLETRVVKWQKYRQQIKEEEALIHKINEKNKFIHSLERKITKIDPSIIIKKDPYDNLVWIPIKKNENVEKITKELENISSKFNDNKIKEIFKLFDKNQNNTISPTINDVSEFEDLFNNDVLSKELEKIDKSVDAIEKEHDIQRTKLRQNKNLITNIISHDISGKERKFINLKRNEIDYKKKISQNFFFIIFSSLILLFLIIAVIFISLWFGGV